LTPDVSEAALDAARTALRELTQDQLEQQRAALTGQVGELSARLSNLAREHDKLVAERHDSTLLNILSGVSLKRGIEEETLSDERRATRTELARAEATLKLVHAEIRWRIDNEQATASAKAEAGWRADYADCILSLQDTLSKAIALFCVLNPGTRPESLNVGNFALRFCPQVIDQSQAKVASIKQAALATFIEKRDREAAWLGQAAEKRAAKAQETVDG